ncbi:MAG: hypothetical protein N3D12_04815 [Candidatus Methanomethyliaceae archaeon]|nr:hypothetical protein [Candidatus Methanomethyliaceae archaeon]
MRKIYLMPIMAIILTCTVMVICVTNQASWQNREYYNDLRYAIGLPSIAIGTNYEGTRNPLLEVFVRSLYDIPGGYDYVVPSSFIDTPLKLKEYYESVPGFNITIRRS